MAIYDAFHLSATETRPGYIDQIRQIPQEYFAAPAAKAGRVERVEYTAPRLGRPGETCRKYCLVYLPWEYDRNPDKRYNILYMIHGGGGSPEEYLPEDGPFVRMLDHSIQNGEIAPMIVVAPTYYPPDSGDISVDFSGVCTAAFMGEMKGCILPEVEGRYRTFAPSADMDGFAASRAHRGIGGFSMGSVTTWYAFQQALSCFGWFLPLSGDSWIEGRRGGVYYPMTTARKLARAVQQQGFTPEDYLIYCITGSNDIAWDAVDAQIHAMQKQRDAFRFGTNIFYGLKDGGWHSVEEVRHYAYHALPDFFAE